MVRREIREKDWVRWIEMAWKEVHDRISTNGQRWRERISLFVQKRSRYDAASTETNEWGIRIRTLD